MKFNRFCFLDIQIDSLVFDSLTQVVTYAAEKKEKWIIANHNLHSLYVYHHDSIMKEFYAAAEYTHAEGMGIIMLAKLLRKGLSRQNRIAYIDWLMPFLSLAAQKEWKIFYLGSKPEIIKKAGEYFKNKIPGLKIQTHHGYFDILEHSDENQEVVAQIQKFAPDVLFVGMGMPRQEHWIIENYTVIPAHVIFDVGALIEYFLGAKAMAPRWLGKIGLEWLYRLLSEPKRLWRRYLIEPWYILGLLLQSFVRRIIIWWK